MSNSAESAFWAAISLFRVLMMDCIARLSFGARRVFAQRFVYRIGVKTEHAARQAEGGD
jgi:hypothetical protein